jgi:ABC-type multidrug transport system ATPase subunit
MGPSGSGKTTLLDVISGRANRGTLSTESKILVNGRERGKHFKKISGYVMQDDALMSK